ncbi:iron-containing alcohol dehydrogenase [Brevibacillus dissolubilis]|uniref:iron-containing alcohol dehydrogenase n=1 Tax=Brevibacillus dissolubilis TaxID=1844116 RepID=UPI0011176728|nr:iron-containing alcohol dehydrogenase [Brevibacillus dissolubilis]
MLPFEVYFPTQIIFGVGELSRVGSEAKKLGKKALLVTGGRSAKATGLLDRICSLLTSEGLPYVVFDKIEPNPRTSSVEAGAQMLREHGCDFIIALGGGSVMDASKAIATIGHSNRPIYDYMRGNPAGLWKELLPITAAVPLMAIPTVAATGSEANNLSVLTHDESREKSSITGPGIIPKVAILDPEITYTVPERVTAESCADIFSHLFEAYLVGVSTAHVQDGITEALIRQVVQFSTVAMEDPTNEEARSTLLWASTLAISPFTLTGRGAGYPLHQVEHPVSGHFDIAHGRGLAILSLPYFEQFILPDRPERLARMGRECFGVNESDTTQAAKATIQAVADWYSRLGITQRLSDFGVTRDSLQVMAQDAIRIGGRGADHIMSSRPMKLEDVLAIYEACF